jgi:hypothetical protein
MLRCVHPELEDCPIVFQRSDDEEEGQHGEEEQCGEEVENVGEGPIKRMMRARRMSVRRRLRLSM